MSLADAIKRFEYLILDTNIIIQEVRFGLASLILPIPRPQRSISILTLYELYHREDGSMISVVERRRRDKWLADNGINVRGPHRNMDKSFRSIVRKNFTPPGVVDCFLAADCLASGAAFVTNNVKHFERVDGLNLVRASTP
jgi:predicted nucleic acid-binding protein